MVIIHWSFSNRKTPKSLLCENTIYESITNTLFAKVAQLANLELNDEQYSWLADIPAFNIEARYEEQKQEFHKKCTEEYTTKYISIIKELHQWLKLKLMK